MSNDRFLERAKECAAKYLNVAYAASGMALAKDDVYVVWFCKTLQNWKALVSTDVCFNGMYVEVTHNGDKGETYVDIYGKFKNFVVEGKENG